MSIRELVELILEFNCDDFKQTAEDINEFFVQFKLSAYQLVAEFEELCKENDRCIECGGKLKTEVIDKYLGFKTEKYENTYCIECGEEY